jgi:uncharacterized protein (TIGR02246 family)
MTRHVSPMLLGFSALLAVAVPAVGSAQQGTAALASDGPAAAHTREEQAIRGVISDLISAWNRHDAAGAAAQMTEDVDMVAPPGMYAHGRAQIEADSPALFATLYKDAHESVTTDRIRFLRPDVALVDGTFTLVGPNFPGDARGLQTVVLVRDRGRWAVAALRRMIPVGAPPGVTSAPTGGAAPGKP